MNFLRRLPIARILRISFRTWIIILLCLIVISQEWLSHFSNSLHWPKLKPKHAHSKLLTILLVADPQLIGYQDEPWAIAPIARWDSDRYVSTTFSYAFAHIKPDVVIFLGDLLDEGSKSTELQYKHYIQRFYQNFPQIKHSVPIFISGDNDIGGEGGETVTQFNIQRFSKAFDTTKSLQNMVFDFTHFIELVAQFQPSLVITAHTHKAYFTQRDTQSPSGHTVRSSINEKGGPYKFTLSTSDLIELQIPTCSYRMGVPKMGYGYLILEQGETQGILAQFVILWLPGRYPQLYFYLVSLSIISFMCFIKLLFGRICR